MKKYIALFVVSIENLKNRKHCTSPKNHQLFLLLAVNANMKMKKYIKKKNQFIY